MATDAKSERDLDETIEESFPASDPPANTVETGIIPHELGPLSERVWDNAAERRFELPVDGKIAFLNYKRTETTITLVHTEVPEDLRGRGVGGALVDGAAARAHAEGLRIVVVCPFAREHLKQHPTR